MLLDQLLRNLESPKCFDLPLRRPIPDGVCPPEYVINTERIDDLPKQMRADSRMGRDKLRKGRAELHIDILDSGCACFMRQNSVVQGISPVFANTVSTVAALLSPE